jgi:hypothetical protein
MIFTPDIPPDRAWDELTPDVQLDVMMTNG